MVRLAELGSHCRGVVFLNCASLETEALRAATDSIARSHAGFYVGRFDVCSPSIQDLKSGRFEVLGLNGVSAEATHIYDPAVSLLEAYRVMFVSGESPSKSERSTAGRRAAYAVPRVCGFVEGEVTMGEETLRD